MGWLLKELHASLNDKRQDMCLLKVEKHKKHYRYIVLFVGVAPGYDKCLPRGVNRVIDHHSVLVSRQQEILREKMKIIFNTRKLIYCNILQYIVKPWTHPNCLSLWLWKRFASRIVWITLVRVGLPCRVKVPAPRFNLGADNFFCSWKLVLTLWSKFKASTPWPSALQWVVHSTVYRYTSTSNITEI